MISKWLLRKERQQLDEAAAQSEWNKLLITQDHAKLKHDLIRGLGGVQGLALSFGAGCATALAYKNREQLSHLQNLPWNQIIGLLQEYSAIAQAQQFEES